MKESYRLLDTLPTIPTPHDCVIRKIYFDGEDLVFDFDQNITHEAAKCYCPTAKSLVVRYHLLEKEFSLYQKKTRKRFNRFVDTFTSMPAENIFKIAEQSRKLEYLYHYISFYSLILILWSGSELRLELPSVDRVEYHWIE